MSERIVPDSTTIDASGMARGEPGLAKVFTWRGRRYEVARMLQQWKGTRRSGRTGGEAYIHRHWFQIDTTSGERMTLYYERQPATRGGSRLWWLYTVEPISTSEPIRPDEGIEPAR